MNLALLIILVLATFIMPGCTGVNSGKGNETTAKIKVVATVFPLYDIARAVGGDKAEVTMLLPPGVEAHTFDPRPSDIARIAQADIFFYIGSGMEPWAGNVLDGIGNQNLTVIDTSSKVVLQKAAESGKVEALQGGYDPHLWLDYSNDEKLADVIASALSRKDPENWQYYSQNAEAYKEKLKTLDREYASSLSNCSMRVFISGGHNAYTYVDSRYNLTSITAFGLSPDSEPTPKTIKDISDIVNEKGAKYILSEQLVDPKVAEAIAQGTGAQIIVFNPGENLPKEGFDSGETFVDLMDSNLKTLVLVLGCQNK